MYQSDNFIAVLRAFYLKITLKFSFQKG